MVRFAVRFRRADTVGKAPVSTSSATTAVVADDVEIGAMVYIGPHAVVGNGTRIGVATSIGAGTVVGKRVNLGEGCVLHPHVTIYDNVDIGRRTILHSGVVIGADGFGYVIDRKSVGSG